MKARTIKYFFSGILFVTALLMSAFSCAEISNSQNRSQYQLFAVQTENIYFFEDERNTTDIKAGGCSSEKKKQPRKEVSWTEWFTSSTKADLHFLNLLELIGG